MATQGSFKKSSPHFTACVTYSPVSLHGVAAFIGLTRGTVEAGREIAYEYLGIKSCRINPINKFWNYAAGLSGPMLNSKAFRLLPRGTSGCLPRARAGPALIPLLLRKNWLASFLPRSLCHSLGGSQHDPKRALVLQTHPLFPPKTLRPLSRLPAELTTAARGEAGKRRSSCVPGAPSAGDALTPALGGPAPRSQ